MKKILLLAVTAVAAVSAHAVLYTVGWTNGVQAFANGTVVPDNNYSGWLDSRNVTTAPAGTLQSVQVDLNLSGGWNGDLYAYLVHGSGYAVLLDRVGYTGSGFGYGTSGMNVTLTNGGYPSIETTALPTAGGVYSPGAGYGGDLGSFGGLGGNGTWQLFIADLSGGNMTTVQSWGLQMDIVAVPEVESWIAAAMAGAFGAFWLNRQIWRGVQKQ